MQGTQLTASGLSRFQPAPLRVTLRRGNQFWSILFGYFELLNRSGYRFDTMLSAVVLLSGLAGVAVAQFPPKPEGVTVLRSKFHENVTISFKEVCRLLPLFLSWMHLIRLSY